MGCMFLETYPFIDYSICWCNWYISILKQFVTYCGSFRPFLIYWFPYYLYPIWSVSISALISLSDLLDCLTAFWNFIFRFTLPSSCFVSGLFPSGLIIHHLKVLELPAASPQLAVQYVLYLVSLRFLPARTMQIQSSRCIRKLGSVLAGGWAETASSECFHRQRSA